MPGPFPWDQPAGGPTAAMDVGFLQWLQTQQQSGKDTSRTSALQSAPPSHQYVYYFADEPVVDANGAPEVDANGKPTGRTKPTLKMEQNANYDSNAVDTTVYGSADSGYFRLDKQGNPIQVQQPNADALVDKAVDRQIKEADRNARARNEAAGVGYVTDVDRARIEKEARAQGLDEATLRQRIFEFSESQKNKDREEARLAAKTEADIIQTTAQ